MFDTLAVYGIYIYIGYKLFFVKLNRFCEYFGNIFYRDIFDNFEKNPKALRLLFKLDLGC